MLSLLRLGPITHETLKSMGCGGCRRIHKLVVAPPPPFRIKALEDSRCCGSTVASRAAPTLRPLRSCTLTIAVGYPSSSDFRAIGRAIPMAKCVPLRRLARAVMWLRALAAWRPRPYELDEILDDC